MTVIRRTASALALAGLALAAPIDAKARLATTAQRPAVDAVSRAFDDAQLRGDVDGLRGLLASDFVYVRGSGLVAGTREFIANFSDPTQHLDPFVITDRRVITIGRDATVIVTDGVIRGTAGGKPFSEDFRYADTFVWRAGRWQVVYVQVTPVGS